MGSFQFIDSGEFIVQEVKFPDGHYEYANSDEEAEEMLKAWQESNSVE